jgi:hypothetical protein
MNDRFTKEDRQVVMKELERIQRVALERTPVSRKLFTDKNGRLYYIFGGTGDWHGIPAPVMEEIAKTANRTLLVFAKKYGTRIDVCVGTAEKFVAQKCELPRTSQGGYQFHTIPEEDGCHVFQIPEVQLRKICEIPLTRKVRKQGLPADVAKIINITMLPSAQATPEELNEEATHADVQAKLILIGSYLGHRTFTPDRAKLSRYGKLGDLVSDTEIPHDYIAARQIGTVKNIDVIWFDADGMPTHCFEVEHTTDVTKGLLRLYQIRKLRIKMFIVAPNGAKTKFDTEIKKDPFYQVQEEYIFKSYTDLEEFFHAVRKFASLRQEFLVEEPKPKRREGKAT